MTDATTTVPMVQAERVMKSFGSHVVLRDISLTVNRGEVMCLVGPSGSGKSTFLRCINHLEQVNAGRLLVDGRLVGYREKHDKLYELKPREAAEQRRDVGMVFQRFNLFPHLTALENVIEAPIHVNGHSKAHATERGKALLDRVGLANKADSYPAHLSGGQQQRVAIARALVTGPSLLLADEPTGNLDTARSREIMDLLAALNRDQGITVVMVTHEPEMAAYAHRTVRLVDGLIASDERRTPGGQP